MQFPVGDIISPIVANKCNGEVPKHPYASQAYAAAFVGKQSVWMENAQTWVLKRNIPSTSHVDAMGCYPLCIFGASDKLPDDFQALAADGIVSLVLVTDCLTQPSSEYLYQHFDLCHIFKKHYLFDPSIGTVNITKHHRDAIRRARRSCHTRVVSLRTHLSDWMACYDTLRIRHQISGIQDFSWDYFERLADMDGIITIGAFIGDRMVSAHIWVANAECVYSHLAASTPEGYKSESSYAIYEHAIELFGRHSVIDFGGVAGGEAEGNNGLRRFKRGFANRECENYLCGKILCDSTYERLSQDTVVSDSVYFPRYRTPSGGV